MPRPQKNPNSKTSRALASRTADKLTIEMKRRRDLFITELIKDWSPQNAVLRAGGAVSTVTKVAYQYMREPYVQQELQKYVDQAKESDIVNRNRILTWLVREANERGIGASHGARVSALSKLATIMGMDAPQKHQVQVSGGVMLVPVTANLSDWEVVAEEKQKLLKEDVRS